MFIHMYMTKDSYLEYITTVFNNENIFKNLKCAHKLSRNFTREAIQMTNKHIKMIF